MIDHNWSYVAAGYALDRRSCSSAYVGWMWSGRAGSERVLRPVTSDD